MFHYRFKCKSHYRLLDYFIVFRAQKLHFDQKLFCMLSSQRQAVKLFQWGELNLRKSARAGKNSDSASPLSVCKLWRENISLFKMASNLNVRLTINGALNR